jgi:hypothetical protein
MDSAKEQPVHGVSLHESTRWRGGVRLLDGETMGQHKAQCLVERRQDGTMAILCGEVGASGSGLVRKSLGPNWGSEPDCGTTSHKETLQLQAWRELKAFMK